MPCYGGRFFQPFTMAQLLQSVLLDPRLNRLRYGAAMLFFITIIIAGSIPGARADIGHYASGVVLHASAYGVLALCWFTASAGSAARRSRATMLAVALMGALDECVQSLFPYRGAAVSDWLVDCSAAAVVCALLWLILPKTAFQPR
jgi:hypothetical protein